MLHLLLCALCIVPSTIVVAASGSTTYVLEICQPIQQHSVKVAQQQLRLEMLRLQNNVDTNGHKELLQGYNYAYRALNKMQTVMAGDQETLQESRQAGSTQDIAKLSHNLKESQDYYNQALEIMKSFDGFINAKHTLGSPATEGKQESVMRSLYAFVKNYANVHRAQAALLLTEKHALQISMQAKIDSLTLQLTQAKSQVATHSNTQERQE